MMVAYVKVSSDVKDESNLEQILRKGKVVNKGIKTKTKLEIPFFKLS